MMKNPRLLPALPLTNLKASSLPLLCLLTAIISLSAETKGQDSVSTDSSRHTLTVYMLPSLRPLHWESPSSLVRSALKGYKAKLFHHRQYLLGHMIVRLESPLAGGTKYSAMVSTSMKEKRVLMLKEKIGLGILGVPMGGKLDSDKDIHRDLTLFSRLKKVVYVKYLISEESARKINHFIDRFSQPENGYPSPSSHYGGAFWPLFHGEGAGCTSYAVATIEAAGLIGREHDHWKVEVNIPLNLVGGDLNDGRKVSTRELRKTMDWARADTATGESFVPFSIFDPTLAYGWIIKQRLLEGDHIYVADEEMGMEGVVADRRYIRPAVNEPVFSKRTDSSLFIDLFQRTRQNQQRLAQSEVLK